MRKREKEIKKIENRKIENKNKNTKILIPNKLKINLSTKANIK